VTKAAYNLFYERRDKDPDYDSFYQRIKNNLTRGPNSLLLFNSSPTKMQLSQEYNSSSRKKVEELEDEVNWEIDILFSEEKKF